MPRRAWIIGILVTWGVWVQVHGQRPDTDAASWRLVNRVSDGAVCAQAVQALQEHHPRLRVRCLPEGQKPGEAKS
jgi:hypothetical protein